MKLRDIKKHLNSLKDLDVEVLIIAIDDIVQDPLIDGAYNCTIDDIKLKEMTEFNDNLLDEDELIFAIMEEIDQEYPNLLDEQANALLDMEYSKYKFKPYLCIYIY